MHSISYINLKQKQDYFMLVIEGDLYPIWVFNFIVKSERYNPIELLIKCFDMEKNDFTVLKETFKHTNIDFKESYDGILVDGKDISRVFLKTDFGKSLDSYKVSLIASNNNTLWLDVSYESIPDLVIKSNNYDILEKMRDQAVNDTILL